MARSIDHSFYESVIWKKCKNDYLKYCGGLCERCKAQGIFVPANIVHHKKHLNKSNVNNPRIAYGFDNLEALCLECHNKEHHGGVRKNRRWSVDNLGRITPLASE